MTIFFHGHVLWRTFRVFRMSSSPGVHPEELLVFLKELKGLMLSYNLLRRLPLLSDFKIEKHFLCCFHSRILTDDVRPPENLSLGRKWLFPLPFMMRLYFLEALSLPIMRDFVSWSLPETSENFFFWSLDSRFEIHASMICKCDSRVNWWNASLLTSKYRVLRLLRSLDTSVVNSASWSLKCGSHV